MRLHTPAAETGASSRRSRVLDPTERTAEVLFGLIMVLTFTGSLSVAQAGRDDVRAMLIGALGCNIAWGIIDAVLYLLACLGEQGHNLSIYRAVRGTRDPEHGRLLIADALPPVVASALDPAGLEHVRQRLLALPARRRARTSRRPPRRSTRSSSASRRSSRNPRPPVPASRWSPTTV